MLTKGIRMVVAATPTDRIPRRQTMFMLMLVMMIKMMMMMMMVVMMMMMRTMMVMMTMMMIGLVKGRQPQIYFGIYFLIGKYFLIGI